MSEVAAPAPVATSGQGAPPINTSSAAPAAPATNGAAPAPVQWSLPTGNISDENKGWIDTKGYKDLASFADSYRNLEKLHGVPQERLLRLPEKADDPNWGQIWNKLGKPTEAKEYNIEVPKEFGDADLAEWTKQTLFELNIPKTQGEALAKKWNERMSAKNQEIVQQRQAAIETQNKELKREWGAAFSQNVELGKKAALELNISADELNGMENSMGFSKTMKLMSSLGTKVGEHKFVDGGKSRFDGALTPEQSRDRLAMMKSDPEIVKRYLNNDMVVKEEWDKLFRMGYPDPID